MNWGFRNVLIGQKPLIDTGAEICPSRIGIPVEPLAYNCLHPHYGGRHFNSNNAPQDYSGFDPHIQDRFQLYPHDTLSFGGYHGGNFLERDAKYSTWKHQ